jgi:HSP20 family protein
MIITERAFGHFRRILPLPAEVDATGARADYRNGVLAIELPKVAASNRRVVQVS